MTAMLIINAIRTAERQHKGQKRKVSGADYISHPVAVSYIVASMKRSKYLDNIIAATIMHDVLEDGTITFVQLAKKFNPMVASLVQELTNDPAEIKRLGKLEYQKKKMVGMSSYALVIKLADRLHNVLDHPTNKMKVDTLELTKYLRRHRKLSNTHTKLITQIERICNTIMVPV